MRRTARHNGFTLIETIAAIVLVAVALPPMMWSIREAHAERANPVLASRARWLAVSKLEDVIADRNSTTRGYAYLLVGNYLAEPTIPGSPGFSRAVTLNETLADLSTPGAGFMIATVSVSWTDAQNVFRTLNVSTVLTEYIP